jgi:4-hydroxy-3-polyprenylbenzoate decarboxylase
LESIGELHRVKVEVDAELEVTEIAVRALRDERPALLFEKVRGARPSGAHQEPARSRTIDRPGHRPAEPLTGPSRAGPLTGFPLAMNLLASERRIELALGKHPEELGEELLAFAEGMMPPRPRAVLDHWSVVRRMLSTPPSRVRRALSQEVVEEPNLDQLPIQKCWPDDGGRFITLGQVITCDPEDGRRNIGVYRMHVFDQRTTGMHWQIQKGGGFHYHKAQKLGRRFEIAVALGTDPALLLATVAALPEGMDEAMFAGFLRGRRTPFVPGKAISMAVPAEAEFILEGEVPLDEARPEGPFGDHFGHYSHAAQFPVFHIKKITRRRHAIYPGTVVGKPPMEDKFLGNATQQILGPLIRLIHKEIRHLWAYYEAGFHNLLVVSVEQRYQKEAMKAALGLMGTDQLSLTKCILLVSEEVDVRDWPQVLRAVQRHFDPHFDFVLLPKVPLDTLDFSSFKMNLGSKMILDATRKPDRPPAPRPDAGRLQAGIDRLVREMPEVVDSRLYEDALLLLKVSGEGRRIVEEAVRRPELAPLRIIAAVSEDVDLDRQESAIWGVFTRFDCERDVVFTEQSLVGACPVYRGVMGIDATWKKGYPEPLVMSDEIIQEVDRKWESYWR